MAGANPRGLLIAAPQSGAGKTTVTLALLRALKNAGRKIVSAKSGPDYIDPKFHEAASGRPCINLDAWAMTPDTVRALGRSHAEAADLLIVEGAMGLFDGAASGKGSMEPRRNLHPAGDIPNSAAAIRHQRAGPQTDGMA